MKTMYMVEVLELDGTFRCFDMYGGRTAVYDDKLDAKCYARQYEQRSLQLRPLQSGELVLPNPCMCEVVEAHADMARWNFDDWIESIKRKAGP